MPAELAYVLDNVAIETHFTLASPDTPVTTVANWFQHMKIKCVVVTVEGGWVGIVTEHCLLRAIASTPPQHLLASDVSLSRAQPSRWNGEPLAGGEIQSEMVACYEAGGGTALAIAHVMVRQPSVVRYADLSFHQIVQHFQTASAEPIAVVNAGEQLIGVITAETTLLAMRQLYQLRTQTMRSGAINSSVEPWNGAILMESEGSEVAHWAGPSEQRPKMAMSRQGEMAATAALTWKQWGMRDRLFTRITTHIRQSLDLDEILAVAVHETRSLLRVERVIIYRFEPDWSGKVVQEAVESPRWSIIDRVIQDPCFSVTWVEPYRQGRVLAIDDLMTAGVTPCHVEFLQQYQVRANLVVPIVCANQLWGLLIAHQCSGPRQWQPWESDFLKHLGEQVAIAVHQANLLAQVRLLNTSLEHKISLRTQQLQTAQTFEAALKRISDSVRESLDESRILQTAVEELRHSLDAVACDAALYDLSAETSTILYESCHFTVPTAVGTTVAFRSCPDLYLALLRGQVLHVCCIAPRPSLLRHIDQRMSVLACPMVDDQQVVGDIWLLRSCEVGFSEQDIKLAQQVADQCAIAIRQSRLYGTLQQQINDLNQLNQLKDDFLNTVSHELRTPISNIKLAAQMLQIILSDSGVLNTAPEQVQRSAERYLKILKEQSQRESMLINDLLDLSRLDSKTNQLMLETVEVSHWMHEVVAPFVERSQAQQQQFQMEVPSSLPVITSDPSKLHRILSELLNNACKYTPPHHHIILRVTAQGNQMKFQVINTGVEIPSDQIPHIFEKFYRVTALDVQKQGGTGLGLALVQKMTEVLYGDIEVKSDRYGTQFILSLPIQFEQATSSLRL